MLMLMLVLMLMLMLMLIMRMLQKWLMLHAHPIVRLVSCAVVAGRDSFKLDRCDGRERVR